MASSGTDGAGMGIDQGEDGTDHIAGETIMVTVHRDTDITRPAG